MRFGLIIGCVETLVGVATGNPVLLVDGSKRAARSLVLGAVLGPVKDLVGDEISTMVDTVS